MLYRCVRNSALFLGLYTVVFVLGATGRIDSFLWGAISTLLYFPASLTDFSIDAKLALTQGTYFDLWDSKIEKFLVFSYMANAAVGVAWWTFITATYVFLKERNSSRS